MKMILALSLLLIVSAPVYGETSPAGEWLVEDRSAHIRIMSCSEKMWGFISWLNEPDTDKNNPDAAKRQQPILGLPILLAMHPAKPNRWEGNIYNPENGKTYKGSIGLAAGDTLHVEGCLWGFLCGGENWTRLKPVAKDEHYLCPR